MKYTNRGERPRAVAPSFDQVPEELKRAKQWVCWEFRWSIRSKAWAKVPVQINGRPASSTDNSTWETFDACSSAYKRAGYDGLGFVFSKDSPFVGIDLDGCVKEVDGALELTPFASQLVTQLGTYTELSPSQTGLHLIGKAGNIQAAKGTCSGNEVELYRDARFFTTTGRVWDEPLKIADVDVHIRRLFSDVKQESKVKSAIASADRKLTQALRDSGIKALFDGDITGYVSQSEADMALCSRLAYYSGGSSETLDAMFRKSKLFRDKWDEQHGADTYGGLTIAKALEGRTSFVGQDQAKVPGGRVVTFDSLYDEIVEFRENGAAKGMHPGWDTLEPLYRPTEGAMTVIVGDPGSGKSTWTNCLTFNLMKLHGWKTFYASFESLPIQRHMLDLMQVHVGQPSFTFVPGHFSKDQFDQAFEYIKDKFYFYDPEEDGFDVESILAGAQECIDLYGIKGLVVDPFTEVDILPRPGESEVKAIGRTLSRIQQFARHHGIHAWVLAHPTKTSELTFKKEDKGLRPTLSSASGASHFRNKTDYGLVIHRWDDDEVDIFVEKVRNDSSGERGKAGFNYFKDRREYADIKPDRWRDEGPGDN